MNRRDFINTSAASTAFVALSPKPAHALWWFVARAALTFVVRNSARQVVRQGSRVISRRATTQSVGAVSAAGAGTTVMRSSRAVAAPTKAAKGARNLNNRQRTQLVERLAAEGADFTLNAFLDTLENSENNVEIPKSSVVVDVSVGSNNSIGKIFTGEFTTTFYNRSSNWKSMDVDSYIMDVDDKNYIRADRSGSGLDIAPYKSLEWKFDAKSKLYQGRKVLITEIDGNIADVSEMFYVKG